MITKSRCKDDRLDARTLARPARIDPDQLSPLKQRGARASCTWQGLRARAGLVSARPASSVDTRMKTRRILVIYKELCSL